jgi:hypothetical protein
MLSLPSSVLLVPAGLGMEMDSIDRMTKTNRRSASQALRMIMVSMLVAVVSGCDINNDSYYCGC